jgi:hypothetical protein
MGIVIKLLAAGIFTLTVWGTGFASEAATCMCKGGIVSPGDALAEVVRKCGEPSQRYQRTEKRGEELKGVKTVSTVVIDDWTYNFGPNEFMYQMLFENGRVVKIESLDYGY